MGTFSVHSFQRTFPMLFFSAFGFLLFTRVTATQDETFDVTRQFSQLDSNVPPDVRSIELTPLDSSFVIHGNRLVGRALHINQGGCPNCTVNVVADINNFTWTTIGIIDGNHQYSVDDIYGKSIVLTLPIDVVGNSNSSMDYVLTFTLLQQDWTLKTRGVDEYSTTQLVFGETSGYEDFTMKNKTKANTMVASNDFTQPPQMQIKKFNVQPGCKIDVFAGGLQTMNGRDRHRVVTLSSDIDLVPSTFRSIALTYVVPPNCPYNISVYNGDVNYTTTTVYPGQTGFLMSTGYPGTMGWRENGEGDKTTRILEVQGDYMVNITFEIVNVDAGQGGSLTISTNVQPEEQSTRTGATTSIVGGSFKIRWNPGPAYTGYLLRYTVAANKIQQVTKQVVLSKEDSSFVVQGNRAVGRTFQLSQSDCPNCTIRVVAQIYKENLTFIQLKDDKNTFSVSDISRGKTILLSLPATVDVLPYSTNDLVLTFTLIQPGQSFHSFGVDYYGPMKLPYNGMEVQIQPNPSDNSTATTLALTNSDRQPPRIQIMDFNLAPGCFIDVFAGGLQANYGGNKHRVVTLRSDLSLASSVIRSTALTYVTPPQCVNNVTVSSRMDDLFSVKTHVGQSGFLMSSGYRGGSGFEETNQSDNETTTIVVDGKRGNFTFTIVSLEGGRLQINDKMSNSKEDNTVVMVQGELVTIKWTPIVPNPRGYLVRYTVTEDHSTNKSSLFSIFYSMIILLIMWCF